MPGDLPPTTSPGGHRLRAAVLAGGAAALLAAACATVRYYRLARLTLDLDERTLDNGLKVVVDREPGANLAALRLAYECGAADDPEGREGLAHLVEHLTFEIRDPRRGDLDARLRAATLSKNAYTSPDRTVYRAELDAADLGAVLEIEAWRMTDRGASLDDKTFERERDVVLSEYRERVADRPEARAWRQVVADLYPHGHPYARWSIGTEASIRGLTIDDARAFWTRCYSPSNATLVIAGDVDPAAAHALVDRHLAPIPGGRRPERASPAPPVPTRRRARVEDDVANARLYVAWPVDPPYREDHLAQIVLRQVLPGWISWRLTTRERLASSVSVSLDEGRLGSALVAEVELERPEDAARAEAAVLDEAALISDFLHKEAIETYRAQAMTSRFFGFESVAARAAALAETVSAGQPAARVAADTVALQDVPRERVRDLAARLLRGDRAGVLLLVPRPGRAEAAPRPARPDLHAADDREQEASAGEDPAAGEAPAAGDDAGAEPPPPVRRSPLDDAVEFRLPNGLRVIAVRAGKLPIASARLVLPAGSRDDPAALPGLSSLALSARTVRRSFWGRRDRLHLGRIGADWGWDLDADDLTLWMHAPSWYLGPALEMFAPQAHASRVEGKVFGQEIAGRRGRLRRLRRDPGRQSWLAGLRGLYGADHPYARAGQPTELTLDRADRGDAADWIERRLVPRGSVLVVAGDLDPAAARPAVEAAFADWGGGDPPPRAKLPPPSGRARALLVPVEGLTQATVRVAFPAGPGVGEDHAARELIVRIARGRAHHRLRERRGASYGVDGWNVPYREAGHLVWWTALDLEAAAEGLRELIDAIDGVRRGERVGRSLERARREALRELRSGTLTAGDAAGRLAFQAAYGLPRDFDARLERAYAATTGAGLRAAAGRLLDPSRRVVAVAAPRAAGLAMLRAGGMTAVEIVEPR